MSRSTILKFCSATFLTLAIGGQAFADLKIGALAPDFTIQAALSGKEFQFSLKDTLKKGPVVLYFYPKSFTSICTLEAHQFAEAMEQFSQLHATVIGLSSDNIETQKEFSSKECRNLFPVGADPKFEVIKAYDAAAAKVAYAKRISYVISPEGKIIDSTDDQGAEKHIINALSALKAWSESKPAR